MENENPRPILSEFAEKFSQAIKKAELVSVLLLVIGLIIHFSGIKNLDFVLIIGAVATAVVYFLYAYSPVDASEVQSTGILNSFPFIVFIYKLSFLSLALVALSLLSLVTSFAFIKTLISVSGLTLISVLIISLITKIDDRSKIYNTTFYLRVVPALLILFYLANIQYHWL